MRSDFDLHVRPMDQFALTPHPPVKQSNALAWWKTAVFYQIAPLVFQDSDDDGMGDLAGILSRLNYIEELRRRRGLAVPCASEPVLRFWL
jgi:hypothetical protein